MQSANTLGQLNAFLLGELAAIEMYRQALCARSPASARAELTACKQSHEARSDALREAIDSVGLKTTDHATLGRTWVPLGAEPALSSQADTVIDALERAEDRMLAHYRTDLGALDHAVRIFLEATLLEQQELTHRVLHELRQRLSG